MIRRAKDELGLLDIRKPRWDDGLLDCHRAVQEHCMWTEADERAWHAGYRFNPRLGEHFAGVCKRYLRLSKGRWAGKPFELDPWQMRHWVHPIFSWVRPDGTRRIRAVYLEIAKKNFKSTFASAVAIYGLAFDGEAGSEVFSLGATKEQAGIVFDQALIMFMESPQLMIRCGVNRNHKLITWHETNSFYKAVCATEKASGWQPHFTIMDELHEWTKPGVWDVWKHGGRARLQPLRFVITNAGDDVESVCYRQRSYALGVADGSIEDHEFFGMVCGATREEAEAEVQAISEGSMDLTVARRCNPAMGIILREEDFIKEAKEAVRNPAELPNFLRFSYSVWRAAGQDEWLQRWWPAAEAKFTAAEMAHLPCFWGLDLAKSRDWTAMVRVWREGTSPNVQYYVLPHFWIPRSRAQELKGLIPMELWEQHGIVTVTEGDVCDYRRVESDMLHLANQQLPQAIIFDPHFAEELTQRFSEQTGVERFKFGQTTADYAGPTEEFEAAVVARRLSHDGNPALAWQIGNCSIYKDRMRGYKKPIKRDADTYKSVDGVQAAIMGMAKAMLYEPENFVMGLD